MKIRIANYFLGIVFLVCVTACGTVSPNTYAKAYAKTADIPPGQSRVTQDSLTGVWKNEEGVTYAFRGNTFQSSGLNGGKPGRYEINPVLSSFLLVFYKDRNVEGAALFPGVQFFFEGIGERDVLRSVFVVLSEDRQTLIIGDKTYVKAGR